MNNTNKYFIAYVIGPIINRTEVDAYTDEAALKKVLRSLPYRLQSKGVEIYSDIKDAWITKVWYAQ